jgi:iron complex outermembrane receptor protein
MALSQLDFGSTAGWRRGAGLLLGASAAALFAGGAAAQERPAAAAANVGEVIVTATRRSEALRDVPIAVTAIDGEKAKLAHVENFVDIPSMVPGATFIFTKGPSTANIQIRGQATLNDAPGLEVPVAIFMDDIYYGTLASFSADFFDVQQIAVLRGPQGTTFGRNVVGGAIQVTSNRPQLGETNGAIDLTASTYLRHGSAGGEARGYFNVALADTLAGRLAFSLKNVDGYTHNLVTGSDLNNIKTIAFRPSIRWQPTDDTAVTGFLSYTHEDSLGPGYTPVGQGAVIAAVTAQRANVWETVQDVDGSNKRDIFAGQVKAELNRSYGDWTAITSYRTLDARQVDEGDGTPLPLNAPSVNRSKEFQFSQEIRFASPSGRRLEYIAGAYYSFENIYKAITIGFDGGYPQSYQSVLAKGQYQLQVINGDSHVMTAAPYAEFKYHLTDQIALTAGGRYTIERKNGYTRRDGSTWAYSGAYDVKLPQKTYKAFTPRAILEFKPQSGMLFYGGVSTGFKGGGYTLTSPLALATSPLQPEKSTSYEGGAKLDFLDRRLQINLAVYRADTRDLQVRTFVNGVLRDTNAGKLRVKGLELESTFSPIQPVQLGVNYAYNDATYVKFVGCAGANTDCTGAAVPHVPKNDLTVFANYTAELGDGGTLSFHADAHWADKYDVTPQRTDPVGALKPIQPFQRAVTGKNGIVNVWMVYAPSNDSWTVQVWAKNLTNEKTAGYGSNYFFNFLSPAEVAAGLNEADRSIYAPPRQVGFTVSYKFD